MSDDEPDIHTLRDMRRLDAKVDRALDILSDLATDVRGIKTRMAAFVQNEVAHDNSIASIRGRLDGIERRLDLRDTDA